MKFTEDQKKQILQKLLETGIQKFGVLGIKKLKVEELTKTAGISKGMFYKFFESKEIFFFQCIESVENRLMEELIYPVLAKEQDLTRALIQIFKEIGTAIVTYPILSILNDSEQFNYLQSRVPAEIIQAHIKKDDSEAIAFIDFCKQKGNTLKTTPAFLSSLLRLIAILPVYASTVGENFDEVRDFIIEATVQRLLQGETND